MGASVSRSPSEILINNGSAASSPIVMRLVYHASLSSLHDIPDPNSHFPHDLLDPRSPSGDFERTPLQLVSGRAVQGPQSSTDSIAFTPLQVRVCGRTGTTVPDPGFDAEKSDRVMTGSAPNFLDPRSPTDGIDRTPLLIGLGRAILDPRSPSEGIEHTPLQVMSGQTLLDPRSPSKGIDRTPLLLVAGACPRANQMTVTQFARPIGCQVEFRAGTQKVLLPDPRSPGLDRTPIQADEGRACYARSTLHEPGEGVGAARGVERGVLVSDPRSPTMDINRTPIHAEYELLAEGQDAWVPLDSPIPVGPCPMDQLDTSSCAHFSPVIPHFPLEDLSACEASAGDLFVPGDESGAECFSVTDTGFPVMVLPAMEATPSEVLEAATDPMRCDDPPTASLISATIKTPPLPAPASIPGQPAMIRAKYAAGGSLGGARRSPLTLRNGENRSSPLGFAPPLLRKSGGGSKSVVDSPRLMVQRRLTHRVESMKGRDSGDPSTPGGWEGHGGGLRRRGAGCRTPTDKENM